MRFFFAIICFAFHYTITSQVLWQFKKDTVITWYYSEGDEFSSSTINTDYWKYILWARSLYMNSEQQYYTDGQNHKVSDGTLKLIAKKETVTKRTVDSKNDDDSLIANKKFLGLNKKTYEYTSGKLTTAKTFNKGYFECRFKIPSQPGYWPAFWLHGGDPNEEIDIMESETVRPNDIHVDTHCPNHCDMVWRFIARESFGSWIKTKTNFADKFNVMSCEWDDEYVKFFLNGEFIAISKVNFNVPKHLAINLAVPSDKGPFGPGPKSEEAAVFEVDYVRVWSKTITEERIEKKLSAEIDAPREQPAISLIKKTNKSFYGKKKNAKNEGIKISLFATMDGYELSVLGNTEGEQPEYTISSLDGKIVKQDKLLLQYNLLDLSVLQSGQYTLHVRWHNQTVNHLLKV